MVTATTTAVVAVDMMTEGLAEVADIRIGEVGAAEVEVEDMTTEGVADMEATTVPQVVGG